MTVNALPGAGVAFDANALAAAVELDMADWWEPTPARYLILRNTRRVRVMLASHHPLRELFATVATRLAALGP